MNVVDPVPGSSTATISLTRGPVAVRSACTTRSTVSATSPVSASKGNELSESWHTKRNLESACRAEPACTVV